MDIYEVIEKYIKDVDVNAPLFSDDIYKYIKTKFKDTSRDKFNTYLSRYEKQNPLFKRYSKGIYYKGVQTVFGLSKIDTTLLILNIYIKNEEEIYGYETGPSLFNKLGLTTQIPSKTYIASNNNRRKINDVENNIILVKPLTKIDKYNYRYYQLLDVLDNKYKVKIESSNYYDILKKYIHNYEIDFKKLLAYATNYKSKDLYEKIALLSKEV